MVRVKFEIEGLDELSRKFQQMAITSQMANSAVNAAADILVEEAQRTVVVRKRKLRQSIIKSVAENGVIHVGVDKKGADYYAHIIEFGSSKQSAKPFMRPSFERSRLRMERAMADELRRGLRL